MRPDVVGGEPGRNWISGDFDGRSPERKIRRIDQSEHMLELIAGKHRPEELLEHMAQFDLEGRRIECDNAVELLMPFAAGGAHAWRDEEDELARTTTQLFELLRTRNDHKVLATVRTLLRALVPETGLLSPQFGDELVNILCHDRHCAEDAELAHTLAQDLLARRGPLDPAHIARLVDALTGKSLDGEARRRAYNVLARRSALSTDDDAAHAPAPSELVGHAEHLITLLEHAAPSVRWAAAQLLHTMTATELGPHEGSLLDLFFTHAHAEVRACASALLFRSPGATERMDVPPPLQPAPSYANSADELAAMLRYQHAPMRAAALSCFQTRSSSARHNAEDVLLDLLEHADSDVRGSAVGLLVQLANEGLFGGGIRGNEQSAWNDNDKRRIIALANLLDHLDEGVRSDARRVFLALDNLELLADFAVNNVAKHAREMLSEWLTSCPAAAQVGRLIKIANIASRPIDNGSFSAAARRGAVDAANGALRTLLLASSR